MTLRFGERLRTGQRVPHHVYLQTGPLPDRRPWPLGDKPVAFYSDPELAAFCVEATNLRQAALEAADEVASS
jgi:hypothetical protein